MRTIALILFSTIFFTAQGQQWTLRQCIDHAYANNLSLKNQRLSHASSQIQYQQAKNDVLPSVNANMGWGGT
ncbi:MAG: TolC family protein [Bacteroidales bacterium]|nr:TolC family protein [Bacteroidales bacterium]